SSLDDPAAQMPTCVEGQVRACPASDDLRAPVEQLCVRGARPYLIGSVKLQVHDRSGRCLVGAHISVDLGRLEEPSRSPYSSLALVLVVPAGPGVPCLALVAALRCAVEDGVVAHDKLQSAPRRPGRGGEGGVVAHDTLQSAPRRRVRLVDGAVVSYERAEAGALGEITGDIGARRPGV